MASSSRWGVAYWYLWGRAFDYADTDTPVPLSLGRASDIAIAVCLLATVSVAALGGSRLAVIWRTHHTSRPVPAT